MAAYRELMLPLDGDPSDVDPPTTEPVSLRRGSVRAGRNAKPDIARGGPTDDDGREGLRRDTGASASGAGVAQKEVHLGDDTLPIHPCQSRPSCCRAGVSSSCLLVLVSSLVLALGDHARPLPRRVSCPLDLVRAESNGAPRLRVAPPRHPRASRLIPRSSRLCQTPGKERLHPPRAHTPTDTNNRRSHAHTNRRLTTGSPTRRCRCGWPSLEAPTPAVSSVCRPSGAVRDNREKERHERQTKGFLK